MTLDKLELTEQDLKDAVARLATTYHVPEPAERNWDRYQRTWRNILEGITRDELLRAITVYQKTDARFWPNPGALRSIVSELRAGRHQERPGRPANACPICGALPELLDAHGNPDENGRSDYIHDRAAHEAAGVVFGRFFR